MLMYELTMGDDRKVLRLDLTHPVAASEAILNDPGPLNRGERDGDQGIQGYQSSSNRTEKARPVSGDSRQKFRDNEARNDRDKKRNQVE